MLARGTCNSSVGVDSQKENRCLSDGRSYDTSRLQSLVRGHWWSNLRKIWYVGAGLKLPVQRLQIAMVAYRANCDFRGAYKFKNLCQC